MWLITTFLAALIVTLAWFIAPKKFKLNALVLMLWGLSIMILVDHIMGYEGGSFIEMETDGLIQSGLVLGIAMLIPILIIWEVMLLISKMKGEFGEPSAGGE